MPVGSNGTSDDLKTIVGDGIAWAHMGVVTAIEDDAAWGVALTVEIQPSGDTITARPKWGGAGNGTGAFWPIAVGDEVHVSLPEGDPLRAVAEAGWTSIPAPPPASWDNAQPQFVHASGVHFRTSGVAPAATLKAVVTEDNLPAQLAAFTAVQAALAALGIPLPPVATYIGQLPAQFRSTAIKTE